MPIKNCYLARIIALATLTGLFSPLCLANGYPWEDNTEQPDIQPFKLPQLESDTHYQDAIPSLLPAPKINPDAIYQAALNCYPEVSTFKMDVDLVAGYRRVNDQYDSSTWPDLSEHYIGIVGKLPLVSATEDSRDRDREYRRRTLTAKAVAGFAKALANRNLSYREIGLYLALEARAVVRVEKGIAPVDEQILMMEKVAATQRNISQYSAETVQYRLAIVAMCDEVKAPRLNQYLKKIADLPKQKPNQKQTYPTLPMPSTSTQSTPTELARESP